LSHLNTKCKKEDSIRDVGQDNLQKYMRRGLIEMVLATDMAKHDEQMRRLDSHYAQCVLAEDGQVVEADWEILQRKFFFLSTILHAADISNPCKPRPIMVGWTERVLTEFWAQGDEEKSLGFDISPLCDRESGVRTVPKSQIGFVSFVVLPMYKALTKIIPEVDEALQLLHGNLAFWKEQEAEQATFESIFRKDTDELADDLVSRKSTGELVDDLAPAPSWPLRTTSERDRSFTDS
jgi:hypothetical protein